MLYIFFSDSAYYIEFTKGSFGQLSRKCTILFTFRAYLLKVWYNTFSLHTKNFDYKIVLLFVIEQDCKNLYLKKINV